MADPDSKVAMPISRAVPSGTAGSSGQPRSGSAGSSGSGGKGVRSPTSSARGSGGVTPSGGSGGGSIFSNMYLVSLFVLLVVNIIITVILAITNTEEGTKVLNTESARIRLNVSSIILVLVGVVSLILGDMNVQSWWGFRGYLLLLGSTVPLNMTLTTIALESLNSSGSAITIWIGTIVLAVALCMLYYGSTGESSTKTAILYGSVIVLILYALFYTIIFGNPVGISTNIPDSDLNSMDSNRYTIIYRSDNQLNGIFKRRLFDQVYLSIAYPTLGMGEYPPLHNSQEIRGSHSLSNYGKCLKMGGSAFLFDIFYEGNASSPNVDTWRVGTINTQSGVVQNQRTISLASVLYETNRAIDLNPDNTRVIYLFLNPRYLTSQKDSIPQMEEVLANLIQENITHITLPSLSVTIPQNEKFERQNLNNARQQVVIFLGGTRLVSSLNSKLKNVVHGVVNLTDCYVRTSGAQAYNAIAYDPEQSNRRLNLGVGSFAGTNESRLAEFVPQDSLRSVQSSFVATLPDTPESDKAYSGEVPVYISHSVCFPFVYPKTIQDFGSNQEFFQGFAPIVSPKKIISMIFYNRDGEDYPARQRMNAEMRCSQMYNNSRVLNPAQDEEWSRLIKNASGQLAATNWCSNYDEGKDGPTIVNVKNPKIFPLVLYNPSSDTTNGGYYGGGMIPKPTLVQTTDGNIYQLRQVIQQETVQSEELD
jgi:hypothetical protein